MLKVLKICTEEIFIKVFKGEIQTQIKRKIQTLHHNAKKFSAKLIALNKNNKQDQKTSNKMELAFSTNSLHN